MKTIFLADAHLSDPNTENYRKLLAFLEQQRGRLDQLVLLGDVLEFWLGYRHCVFSAYVPLLEELDRLVRSGTKLIYVEGNHDFHLGPYFADTLKARIIPDSETLEIDGLRVFVAHGDLANPDDVSYRRLRGFLRSGLLKTLAKIITPDQAWRIARWGSGRSQQSHNGKSRRWPARDILLPYARTHLQAGNDAVIVGHFHDPFHERLETGQVISLGDWITQYSYALLEDGELSLHTYEG